MAKATRQSTMDAANKVFQETENEFMNSFITSSNPMNASEIVKDINSKEADLTTDFTKPIETKEVVLQEKKATYRLSFTLSKKEKDKIKMCAIKKNVNISDFVRSAVRWLFEDFDNNYKLVENVQCSNKQETQIVVSFTEQEKKQLRYLKFQKEITITELLVKLSIYKINN